MKYKLFLILDYPKSFSIILEHPSLYQTSDKSSGYEQTLRKKNLQLTELQLFINNIASFLSILFVLSARRQDFQFNTLIKCFTFFKFSYLKITQQSSALQSTL